MTRRLLNLLTTLSLLLCVAVAMLWLASPVTVGSYRDPFSGDNTGPRAFGYPLAFHSSGAAMGLHWHYIRRPGDVLSIGSMWAEAKPNRMGFAWNVAPTGQISPTGKPWARQGTVALPHWFVIASTAFLPGLWLRLRRQAWYRSQHRLCPS